MSSNVQLNLRLWHRAAIAALAVLIIVLSVAAGLLTREGVIAQSTKRHGSVIEGVSGGIPGGVQGGVPGGVSAGVPGGVPGGIGDLVPLAEQEKLIERLDQAPEMSVGFKNRGGVPLQITDAKVRAVLRVEEGPGDEYAVIPVVRLLNDTDRRIRGFSLEFSSGIESRGYFELISSSLDARATYTSGNQRRFVILPGVPSGWSVRVAGVLFVEGDSWGLVPPPPPPPPPPIEMKQLEESPEVLIRFKDNEGSPLSIKSATVKAVRVESRSGRDVSPSDQPNYLIRLAVFLTNTTTRRISGVAIGWSNPETMNITYATVKIEPGATYRLQAPRMDGPGFGIVGLRGDPNSIEVQVVGGQFEDGETWGKYPMQPPPPPPPPRQQENLDSAKLIRKSRGVLAASATNRVDAVYPPLALAARVSGSVVVEVVVDEAGNVVSARAISGHPLLKDAAVDAAREWKFEPTMLGGISVKVIGTLTFNFEI